MGVPYILALATTNIQKKDSTFSAMIYSYIIWFSVMAIVQIAMTIIYYKKTKVTFIDSRAQPDDNMRNAPLLEANQQNMNRLNMGRPPNQNANIPQSMSNS